MWGSAGLGREGGEGRLPWCKWRAYTLASGRLRLTCACQLSRLEFDNVLRVRLPMIVDDELSVHLAATCIGHDAVEREPL